MGTTYDVGDTIRVTATYTDTGGVAIDPTTITFIKKTPDGAVTSQTTGITNPTSGSHYVDIVTTGQGLYEYVFTSTGNVVQRAQSWFSVRTNRASTA
jgi:hypothetical protein